MANNAEKHLTPLFVGGKILTLGNFTQTNQSVSPFVKVKTGR